MKKIICVLSAMAMALTVNMAAAQKPAHANGQAKAKGQKILSHVLQYDNLFTARLSGAQEVTTPAGGVETNLTGRARLLVDKEFSHMNVSVAISDASSVVGVHLHCGRAGENGPLAAGLVSPGPFTINNNRIFGSITNADVMGEGCADLIGRPLNNIASLAYAIREGLIYINVHTTDHPAGEIRGQLQ